MRAIAIFSVLASVGTASCGSVGPAQSPLSEKPVQFIDAATGAPVESVLVIPQYSVSTGVSTWGGHGPGAMTGSLFIAFPVVYRSGELLKIRQPDSKGVLLPGAFVGQGVSVKGATVIAPGYSGVWFGELWGRPGGLKVPLTAMTEGWEAHRDRFLEHLGKSRIRGSELNYLESELLNVIQEFSIEVKLDKSDRDRIRQFLRGPVVR